MSFNLSDLRKLVKEELSKKSKTNEGIYGNRKNSGFDPGYSPGLEVMPPEVSRHLPNPKFVQDRIRRNDELARQEAVRKVQAQLDAYFAESAQETSIKEIASKLIKNLMKNLFGNRITEDQEAGEMLRATRILIDWYYSITGTEEPKAIVADLINRLDKAGLVKVVNFIGDTLRKTGVAEFAASTEPKK